MSSEFQTVVVLDTGCERHCYETALGVWREDSNRKHHSIHVQYEDPETGKIEEDSIYGGTILYCAPTYDREDIPSLEDLLEETTALEESYWGRE